jgi:hypothetical protein
LENQVCCKDLSIDIPEWMTLPTHARRRSDKQANNQPRLLGSRATVTSKRDEQRCRKRRDDDGMDLSA